MMLGERRFIERLDAAKVGVVHTTSHRKMILVGWLEGLGNRGVKAIRANYGPRARLVHLSCLTPTGARYASLELDQFLDARPLTDLNVGLALCTLKESPVERYSPLAQEIAQMFFWRFDGIPDDVSIYVVPHHR